MKKELYIYQLLERIIRGHFTCQISDEQSFRIRDLTGYEIIAVQECYNITYNKAISEGLLTDEEVVQKAIKEGKWNEDDDISVIEKQIKLVKRSIHLNRYKYEVVKALSQKLSHLEKTKQELEKKYLSLFDMNSAKYVANLSMINKHLSLVLPNIWLSDKDKMLVYSCIIDNSLSISDIRKVARSSIWFDRYRGMKEHIIKPIFDSVLNLTYYQEQLLRWTYVYEYAYSSPNRPSDDVFNDDDSFDRWLVEDSKRDKHTKSSRDGSIEEVFIMSDQKGAKEVYNKNTMSGRKIISATSSLLQSKNKVSERERLKSLRKPLLGE